MVIDDEISILLLRSCLQKALHPRPIDQKKASKKFNNEINIYRECAINCYCASCRAVGFFTLPFGCCPCIITVIGIFGEDFSRILGISEVEVNQIKIAFAWCT